MTSSNSQKRSYLVQESGVKLLGGKDCSKATQAITYFAQLLVEESGVNFQNVIHRQFRSVAMTFNQISVAITSPYDLFIGPIKSTSNFASLSTRTGELELTLISNFASLGYLLFKY